MPGTSIMAVVSGLFCIVIVIQGLVVQSFAS